MIKVVTWNINSINSRLARVEAFLRRESPDYLCIQELKCADDKFPLQAIHDLGYHAAFFGQKAYNGVAILSRQPVDIMFKNFQDQVSDDAARSITVRTSHGFDLICGYIPNGQSVGSEKYRYKLEWLARARAFLMQHWRPTDPLIFVGDFNIAPDDRDVYDPVAWREHIHCSSGERKALEALVSFGLIDALRMYDQSAGVFSWWDYRELSFAKDKGLRIDLIYATPPAAARCRNVRVDRDERRGEKPSDHAPVIATFDL
jgi:exodeoxyribonuclease-3